MNEKQNEAISESLGLNPVPTTSLTKEEKALATVLENDASLESDFVTARENLRSLSEKALQIVDDLQELAFDTENPKLFESLASMIKNATETNEKLIAISKVRKETHKIAGSRGTDPQEQEKQQPGQINVQNAVFIGSTKDITSLIEKQKREQEKNIIDVSSEPDSNN
jgi:uncharacterized protein with von Willebrand factor type A (vWA) domain